MSACKIWISVVCTQNQHLEEEEEETPSEKTFECSYCAMLCFAHLVELISEMFNSTQKWICSKEILQSVWSHVRFMIRLFQNYTTLYYEYEGWHGIIYICKTYSEMQTQSHSRKNLKNFVTLYNFIIVRLKQTQTTDAMLKEHLLNEHTGVCSAAVLHFIELNMAMLCWIVW